MKKLITLAILAAFLVSIGVGCTGGTTQATKKDGGSPPAKTDK